MDLRFASGGVGLGDFARIWLANVTSPPCTVRHIGSSTEHYLVVCYCTCHARRLHVPRMGRLLQGSDRVQGTVEKVGLCQKSST